MNKGFVFGKFLPFHKGHEAMINFASNKCDFLSVLVCVSDKEKISGSIRKKWIEQTFCNNSKIEVLEYFYKADELTNESKASMSASEEWSKVFKELFPDYSILVTSEEYGNMVAEFMNIKHILFDIQRDNVSVSATNIRNDIFQNWNYLPESVKSFFAIKVVIAGTESTGKSTLTQKLAKHFNCSFVLETARGIITHSNSFTYDDLNLVALKHADRIREAVLGNSPLVIIDTDIHTTKSYSTHFLNRDLEIVSNVYDWNKASLCLYLDKDVQYIQDGTRLTHEERDRLDISHRQVLKEHGVEIIELCGTWNQRFELAVEKISILIKANRQLNLGS